MWKWLGRIDPDATGATEVELDFGQMLEEGRHIFDAAANAYLGGTDPAIVRENLFATDKRINHLERKIRRRILVHGTVHGLSQLPHCLVMMSIVKDAERIGDYCKNLYDLAAIQRKSSDDAYHPDLVRIRDDITKMLGEARELHSSQDESRSQEYCRRTDALQDHCDEMLYKLIGSDPGTKQPASTALAYRYCKRILAHLNNIVSSIFMPVDKLDYFDESAETRD